MYPEKFKKSIEAVEHAREENIAYEPARMTAKEKQELLAAYHPDYRKKEFEELKIGVNKGEKVPHELCAMLQAHSRIHPEEVELSHVDYDVDVLIIGGGGAGAAAAIEADQAGAKTMIATKLRMGDANTMMAEGGIQAADKPNDSPAIHFLDAFGGGHFAAKRELLSRLVNDAPGAILWLNNLGVEFDKAHHARRRHIPQADARCKGLLWRGDYAHPARRGVESGNPRGGFHFRHRAYFG